MEVTYTNEHNETVTLKQIKPYFIRNLDGVGEIRQTINTFHAPSQDGEFFISSTIDMRNITIEGNIVADSIEDTFDYRKQLLKIFMPKLHGTLIYRNYQISCIVEEAGFSVSNVGRAPNFFISLLCPSPYFESIDKIRAELASWMPKFQFPLEIISPGIEMGVRMPSQIMTIDNFGDVPCGCEIIFKALGSVTNPSLMNVDTNEFMKLNTTMSSGEEIHVYTHFANKRVVQIINNVESNAFSLVDVGSTFLQLSTGENTLRYNADDNLDLLEIQILYRPQYLGT